jgi:dTMP kinase
MEGSPLAFHERVRQGFLALAAVSPERYYVLDSTATIDETQRQVRTKTLERLGAR